jgi:hypothetical protein
LLEELEDLEDTIYHHLLPNNDIKKIRAIDKYIGLLKKAYTIQMSSREFELLQLNEPIFKTQKWQEFMNKKLEQLGYEENLIQYKPYLEDTNQNIKEFYALVSERDQGFLDIANKGFEDQGDKAAFLIAGGYHTQNLAKLLRSSGYSYLVITPIVEHETDHKKYEANLLKPLKMIGSDDPSTILRSNRNAVSSTKLNQAALGTDLASVNNGIVMELTDLYGVSARMSQALNVVRNRTPNKSSNSNNSPEENPTEIIESTEGDDTFELTPTNQAIYNIRDKLSTLRVTQLWSPYAQLYVRLGRLGFDASDQLSVALEQLEKQKSWNDYANTFLASIELGYKVDNGEVDMFLNKILEENYSQSPREYADVFLKALDLGLKNKEEDAEVALEYLKGRKFDEHYDRVVAGLERRRIGFEPKKKAPPQRLLTAIWVGLVEPSVLLVT